MDVGDISGALASSPKNQKRRLSLLKREANANSDTDEPVGGDDDEGEASERYLDFSMIGAAVNTREGLRRAGLGGLGSKHTSVDVMKRILQEMAYPSIKYLPQK